MIDPEGLAQVGDIMREGGALVCSPEVAAALRELLPPDVLAAVGDRIIAHPWLRAGEVWACYPGVTIVRPVGAVAS